MEKSKEEQLNNYSKQRTPPEVLLYVKDEHSTHIYIQFKTRLISPTTLVQHQKKERVHLEPPNLKNCYTCYRSNSYWEFQCAPYKNSGKRKNIDKFHIKEI